MVKPTSEVLFLVWTPSIAALNEQMLDHCIETYPCTLDEVFQMFVCATKLRAAEETRYHPQLNGDADAVLMSTLPNAAPSGSDRA